MADDDVIITEKDEEIKTFESNIDNKSDSKDEKDYSGDQYDYHLDSLETLLLIHIIIKNEKDKNRLDWSLIKESLLKETEKLKDLNITNNISIKSEEEIKVFFDKIKENFGKDNINSLESLIKNKRIEKIYNQINLYNKQLKEKEEIIDNIKQNYLNELELEQEKEREKEREKEKEKEKEIEKENDEEKEKDKEKEKIKDKEKVNNNTTTTTTTTTTTSTTEKNTPSSKPKRNQKQTPTTPSSSNISISTTTNDDDEQRRREEEQQRASSKKILYASMLKVWKGLNSNRFAYIFRYPITKDEAPDYDSVIKHRMDLTTLKKKLDDQVYNSCSEFNKDVHLIFKNAMAYNQEDSDIYNMAVSMKKIAEKEMEPCFATEELLQSGAANALGTRSNRSGSNTPLSSSTGNTLSSGGGGVSGGGSGSSMPSPSIRGRNKSTVNTTISANSSTSSNTTATTSTTPRSKKNTSSTSIASESDQSNPNTPSLQEETIDTSDHDSSTSKSSKGRTTRSSTRKSTTAESTPELKEDTIPIKKVSKRQRNSKTDETITHQDEL
ncbi:hypothetical protein ACTFIU_011167 [Dictyostelium citrinum]